jgi:hypothetical protein
MERILPRGLGTKDIHAGGSGEPQDLHNLILLMIITIGTQSEKTKINIYYSRTFGSLAYTGLIL